MVSRLFKIFRSSWLCYDCKALNYIIAVDSNIELLRNMKTTKFPYAKHIKKLTFISYQLQHSMEVWYVLCVPDPWVPGNDKYLLGKLIGNAVLLFLYIYICWLHRKNPDALWIYSISKDFWFMASFIVKCLVEIAILNRYKLMRINICLQ